MNTFNFMKLDFNSTLFPLKTNLIAAEFSSEEINNYIYTEISSNKENFLAQQRVFATKPHGHLRRTVKLDPVSDYFLYDIVFRNRKLFRGSVSEKRKCFGYIFKEGAIVDIHESFKEYKDDLIFSDLIYKHKIQFDIASYFNSIYQHDLAYWFSGLNKVSVDDKNVFGKFFREANSGRSIDILPQGIYPTKMIGNEFLKFIDLHKQLKSSRIIRFMDDFSLFDDDQEILRQDFFKIQKILGQYGLNVNPNKTFFDRQETEVDAKIKEIKKSLKEIIIDIEPIYTASSVELGREIEIEIEKKLDQSQIDELVRLLRRESLDETEADMILSFLHLHSDSILDHIPDLVKKFPNLIKHIYAISAKIVDKENLGKILLDLLNTSELFLEYQIFWIACLAEDFLSNTKVFGDILVKLYELSSEYKIARAKVLEIPVIEFGFKEIRKSYLQSGQSDWLSWSSAMGTRMYNSDERNYVLNYFSNCSSMNKLISNCVKKFEYEKE